MVNDAGTSAPTRPIDPARRGRAVDTSGRARPVGLRPVELRLVEPAQLAGRAEGNGPARSPRLTTSPDSARLRRPTPQDEPLWRHLVGDELRARRHERGRTLAETAKRAGVSPQYLSEMERGLKDASSEMIAAVAGALESDLVDLTSAIADTLRRRADLAQHPAAEKAAPRGVTLALAA